MPFFWGGAYHVFFQYYPGVPYSATMHWGHAVSTDLVHWESCRWRSRPRPVRPDGEGCWTGCVVETGGVFRALYTGIPRLAAGGLAAGAVPGHQPRPA